MVLVLQNQNTDLDSIPAPTRTMAGILLEPELLMELKRVAAALRYKSMSEMVRIVMRAYLEQVKESQMKGEEKGRE